MRKKSKYTTRPDGSKETTRTYKHFGAVEYTGKKHFYGKDDSEIDRKIDEFERLCIDPSYGKTVSDLIDEWWNYKESKLSPNSVSSYKAKKEEIRNRFGDYGIKEVKPSQIVAWLNLVAAQGYSQRGVSDRKSVIKNIFDYALAHEYVETNPCANLPIVKGEPRERRKPAEENDISILEAHKTDSMIARLYYFLEYTGCRIGEAIVLQERDIDRENHKATINKDVAFVGNVPTVKNKPKTEAGIREIDLYDNVLEILPSYDDPNTFVFFPDGLPHKSALQKKQTRFRASIGISSTAHQLRHSYAGIMHSAQLSAKDTQARMGHSSVSITQDIYTEIEKQHNESVRNKANDYILHERLGRDKKRCPHCGSIHVSADGHVFKFCPDCGGILNP